MGVEDFIQEGERKILEEFSKRRSSPFYIPKLILKFFLFLLFTIIIFYGMYWIFDKFNSSYSPSNDYYENCYIEYDLGGFPTVICE